MDIRIVSEEELRKMPIADLKQLKNEYWAYAQGHELPEYVPWIVKHLGQDGRYINMTTNIVVHWNQENTHMWSVRVGGKRVMAEGVFVPGKWLELFEDLYNQACQKADEGRRQRREIERQKLINELTPV